MAKLIFLDRDFAGRVYELVVERTTVGRGDKNTLVLRHETVSSNHCEILANDPEIIVRDLGSRNGTFVDGVRITGQLQARSGQTIRFGQVEARLELAPQKADDFEGDETAVRQHQWAMRPSVAAQRTGPPSPVQPVPQRAGSRERSAEEPTILSPLTSMPRDAPVAPGEATPLLAQRSRRGPLIAVVVVVAIGIVALLWKVLTRN